MISNIVVKKVSTLAGTIFNIRIKSYIFQSYNDQSLSGIILPGSLLLMDDDNPNMRRDQPKDTCC